jgi:ESX-1-secreted protein regulator
VHLAAPAGGQVRPGPAIIPAVLPPLLIVRGQAQTALDQSPAMAYSLVVWRPLPDDAVYDDVAATTPALRTLADKVNWLISAARPADRAPYSNAEVAALIREATGEPVTGTAISKLRTGQAANPPQRLIAALAQFFGVLPDFFFDGYHGDQAGLTQEQAEMLALIRAARITPADFRVLLELSPEARQLLLGFITAAARDQAQHHDTLGEPAP